MKADSCQENTHVWIRQRKRYRRYIQHRPVISNPVRGMQAQLYDRPYLQERLFRSPTNLSNWMVPGFLYSLCLERYQAKDPNRVLWVRQPWMMATGFPAATQGDRSSNTLCARLRFAPYYTSPSVVVLRRLKRPGCRFALPLCSFRPLQ